MHWQRDRPGTLSTLQSCKFSFLPGMISLLFLDSPYPCLSMIHAILLIKNHLKQDDCNGGEGAGVVCDIRDLKDILDSECFQVFRLSSKN